MGACRRSSRTKPSERTLTFEPGWWPVRRLGIEPNRLLANVEERLLRRQISMRFRTRLFSVTYCRFQRLAVSVLILVETCGFRVLVTAQNHLQCTSAQRALCGPPATSGGLGRVEVGGWRGARSAGTPARDRVAVSGMRSGVQALRPSATAAVATPEYVPISYDPARRAAAQRLPRARSARGETGMGGAVQPIHGAV